MKKYYVGLALVLCNVLYAMEKGALIPGGNNPNYGAMLGQDVTHAIIDHEEDPTFIAEVQKRKIRKNAKLKEACTANVLGCATTTTALSVFFCCPSTTACLVAAGGITQMFWSILRHCCITCDADPFDQYCNLSDD